MKSLHLLSSLMLAPMMFSGNNGRNINSIDFSKKTAPKPNGVKRFEINGKEVWAINEKNAIRKAAKL